MDPVINNIVYDNDNFPCFIENGEEIEDPATAPNEEEKYKRIARNGFRHLIRGKTITESKLKSWTVIKALLLKPNPMLFAALRTEFQNIFNNIFIRLTQNQLDPDAQKRCEIFIKNLLCAYPFFDPAEDDVLILPQKINHRWQQVSYRVKKIDISPQTGFLAKLIEDEDRIYAYGLVPQDINAHPYLIFEGTTYPSRTSVQLNWLYNFKPFTSVGEGHDTTLVKQWLKEQFDIYGRKTILIGHSKGGTVSIINAILFGDLLEEADALNPTGFCPTTFARVEREWQKLGNKSRINIYTQADDPVFLIDSKLLKDANVHVYLIGKKTGVYNIASHAHYFTGRKSAPIELLTNLDKEMFSRKRELVSDMKEAANFPMYLTLGSKFIYQKFVQKVQRYFDNHPYLKILFNLFLMSAFIGTCTGLLASGVGAPVTLPLVAYVGTPLAYSLLGLSTLGLAAPLGFYGFNAAKFLVNTISTISWTVASLNTFIISLTVGAILSSIKIGFKSLCCPTRKAIQIQEDIEANFPEVENTSTKNALQTLHKIPSCPNFSNVIEQPLIKKCKSESDLVKLSLMTKQNEANIVQEASNDQENYRYRPG